MVANFSAVSSSRALYQSATALTAVIPKVRGLSRDTFSSASLSADAACANSCLAVSCSPSRSAAWARSARSALTLCADAQLT